MGKIIISPLIIITLNFNFLEQIIYQEIVFFYFKLKEEKFLNYPTKIILFIIFLD